MRFANYPTHDLVYEIVGLVKDARHDSLREQPSRFIYLPIPQSVERIRRLALDVRCAGDAAAFAAPVKRELQAVRPAFPINDISTIARQTPAVVAQRAARDGAVRRLRSVGAAARLHRPLRGPGLRRHSPDG